MPRMGPPAKGQKAKKAKAPGGTQRAARKSNAKRRADDEAASKAQAAPLPRARVKAAPRRDTLPSKAEIRDFLATTGGRVSKTEIARHFGLPTEQRPALRQLLSEMRTDGTTAPMGKRSFVGGGTPGAKPARATRETLPETGVVEVFGTDPDGDPIARPLNWDGPGRPVVYMHAERRGQTALAPGERVLARLKHLGGDRYEGRTLKRLGQPQEQKRILGVFQDGRIIPTDRRQKAEWAVPPGEEGGARGGEIVLAESLPSTGYGLRPARIVERLGVVGEPRSVSLICIHTHGIPDIFPRVAEAEAERARGVALGKRTDLREVPLVTIDGDDARDFDDAVFAEPEGPEGEGGWRVIVAIADVAHYVKPGSALDREAWTRGNSVYFPDRVVPMLPEALSNGWCSLKPRENRGCLFVEMRFDGQGNKLSHRFGRGLMRSAARLTYQEVQAAHDAGEEPQGLAPGHVGRLYGAFRALLAARERRGTLELDLPERRVLLDAEGKVTGVIPRPRLDSHRLIEEFMVAANVCAAEELERLGQPCMYRIHAPPSDEKLRSLREFLGTLDLTLAVTGTIRPAHFARLLEKVQGRPEARMVHETVLRSQSQAAYEPDNLGHFGLALARYAHFTSPIRRYADLLVHRALIRGLKLGTDGLTEAEAARYPDTAEHITATERRAAAAEREAVDRFLAAYLAERVGAVFAARISGIHAFGVFVTLDETGASGFVPMKALPQDFWVVEEGNRRLLGRHSRQVIALGDAVDARLREANGQTGSLLFELQMGGSAAPLRGGRRRKA